MSWIALKMLTGNRGKYLGIILGIGFASLLIAQQASIFCGLMLQTSGQIRDIQGASIWVMDPNVQFSDDVKPLSENDLYRVRGVTGVSWAVRLYKGLTRSRLEDGNFQQTILLGLDDATLIGAPPNMIKGSIFDLRKPDAVIMDLEGYQLLWPGEEPRLGKRFEMNDHVAEIVGICKASRTFQTFPVVYTRYTQALNFVPPERKVLSFILAEPAPGLSVDEVCKRIQTQTGMRAATGKQFEWITMWYFMKKTGIPFNFGITVALGFIVGTAIAAQTFYLFTIENIKQYGALKAMGAGNWTLMGMILLQAMLVSLIGFGLGIGAATWFGKIATSPGSRLAFYMPPEVFVGTALAVGAISVLSSLLSMQRVMVVEPAVVFQG
ncbi:MAG TPA: ABC transporter permease [Lacipirellulaceae bacterium]|jgi:putative ABC transport system permease protein|nr:ABC transporter permease [Lacipirellulaceae bacterium]